MTWGVERRRSERYLLIPTSVIQSARPTFVVRKRPETLGSVGIRQIAGPA